MCGPNDKVHYGCYQNCGAFKVSGLSAGAFYDLVMNRNRGANYD